MSGGKGVDQGFYSSKTLNKLLINNKPDSCVNCQLMTVMMVVDDGGGELVRLSNTAINDQSIFLTKYSCVM